MLCVLHTDSTDIIDSRIKLILGLIWTLILHYSISMPLWEGEDDYGPGAREGPTPKQRLLIWVQNKIPEVPIRNFTSDWNDGKAIGALVDAVGPGTYLYYSLLTFFLCCFCSRSLYWSVCRIAMVCIFDLIVYRPVSRMDRLGSSAG